MFLHTKLYCTLSLGISVYKVLVFGHCSVSVSPGSCAHPSHAWITSEFNTFALEHSVYWTDETCFLHMTGLLFGEMIREDGMSVRKIIECLL
jgi:hypothetical protein